MAKQQDPKKKAEEIKNSFEDVTLSIKDLEKELTKVFNTKKLDSFIKTLTSGFEDTIDYSKQVQNKVTDMDKSVTMLSKNFKSLRAELNNVSKDILDIKVPDLKIKTDTSKLQEDVKDIHNLELNPIVKYNTQPIELPNIDNIEKSINYNVKDIELPEIKDIESAVKYNVNDIELPNINDIALNAKLNKIDLSELDKKMPVIELMAELVLVDTSLIDKTITKYNPIIIDSIINSPDVSEVENVTKKLPSIQLLTETIQPEIKPPAEIISPDATSQVQQVVSGTSEVTDNINLSTKSVDNLQKRYENILKKIERGGLEVLKPSDRKFLKDYGDQARKVFSRFAEDKIEAFDAGKEIETLKKQMATYDGPRIKNSKLINKELAEQLGFTKVIENASRNLNVSAELNDKIQERVNKLKESGTESDNKSIQAHNQVQKIISKNVKEYESIGKSLIDIEQNAYKLGTSEYRTLDINDEIFDTKKRLREIDLQQNRLSEDRSNMSAEDYSLALNTLEAQKKITEEHLEQYNSMQEQVKTYNALQSKAEGMRDTMMKPVDKLFGLVPDNISKMLGLDTIQKEMKDKVFKSIADGFISAGGGMKGFFSAAISGSSALMASLAPILPILLAIAGVVALVKLFMNADKAVGDLAKDLNISYKEAIKVKDTALDISTNMKLANVNLESVTKQMSELYKVTGINFGLLAQTNQKAKDFLETSTALTAQYGLTADETVALSSAAAVAGSTVEKMTLMAENFGDDIVSSADIMKDISKTSKKVLANFKGNAPALAAAVKQAKMMGTSLDKMADSMENVLDIETSVTNENKARILLNRDINMGAARYYAMLGDEKKYMEEIKKQAGSVSDYYNMMPMQKKALASALGMSDDALAEMMAKEKELEAMGISQEELETRMLAVKNKELTAAEALNGLKDDEAKKMMMQKLNEQSRASIQEKLGNTITKITDLLYKMIEPLLPAVDAFVESLGDGEGVLSGISSAFSVIGDIVANVIFPILKIAFLPLKATVTFVMKIIKKIGDSLSGIFGEAEEGSSAFSTIGDILNSISDVLGKVMNGVGAVIADVIMKPFVFIADLIGGIVKIFKGDFVGGIKQIGGAILEWLLFPFKLVGDFIDNVFGTNIVESITEIFSNVADAIFDIFGGVWDLIVGIFTFDGDKILEGIKSIGTGLYNALVQPFVDAWDWITGWFGGNSPSKLGETIVNGISSVASSLFDFITAPFKMAWDFIGGLFGADNLGSDIIDGFKSVFSDIGGFITDYLGGVWDVIAGIFTFDGDRILSGLKNIGNAILGIFSYAWDGIKSMFSGLGDLILNGISSIGSTLYDYLIQPWVDAWDWITGLFGGNSPSKLGDSILTGIESVGSSVLDALSWPFRKAWDFIGELFDVKELGTTMINGIKSFGKKIIDVVKAPFVKSINWIDDTFGGIGTKIVDGISGIASDVWNFITSPFKKAWDWITNLFSGVGTKIVEGLSNLGSAVWDSVTGAFKSGYDWVVNTFSNVGQKIVDGVSSVGSAIVDSITAPFTQAWDSISGWLGFSPSELGNSIVKGISSVSDNVQSNLTKPFNDAEKQVSKHVDSMTDSVSNISGNASVSIQGLDGVNADQIKAISDALGTSLTGGDLLSNMFSSDPFAVLNDIANIEYSEIDSLAASIDNLAKSYDVLIASMKNITDEDIARMQQIASAMPKDIGTDGLTDKLGGAIGSAITDVTDLVGGAFSKVGSFFGFEDTNEEVEKPNVAVSTSNVTPVMQTPAQVNTMTAPIVTESTTSNKTDQNLNSQDLKKIAELLNQLIIKVDQPVVFKIGDKSIYEIGRQIAVRKTYSADSRTGGVL